MHTHITRLVLCISVFPTLALYFFSKFKIRMTEVLQCSQNEDGDNFYIVGPANSAYQERSKI